MHTTVPSIPLGSTAPDNSGPIGWAEKRGIEPITVMFSNPLGSAAPDNRKPIGWAKKICKPE